jgi:hypothetical protein
MSVVNTVFGRPGPHVVAELGDYSASLIANDSGVPGDSVADAQDELAVEILNRVNVAADIEGSAAAPRVAKIQGYAVHDAPPADGDVLTFSELNGRWEPKAVPPTTATGYTIIGDFNFTTEATTVGNTAFANTLIPFTETFGGIQFTAVNPSYALFGEGTPPYTRNVNGLGYCLVGIGSTFMRGGGSSAYLVTDIRTLPGYVAGRKYGCLAVVNYNIAAARLASMAYVGCFDPNPYYPGFNQWVTQANDSGFGCGAAPRADTGNNDYKPVLSAPVVSSSPLEDVPDRMGSQFRPFTHSYDYILGTLRRGVDYAEGVAGPYSGAAPVIEQLFSVGGVETRWNGSMANLRWGVCWKGWASNRHQQYCYVRRMIFYQSKE